jgi:hypothetical protein
VTHLAIGKKKWQCGIETTKKSGNVALKRVVKQTWIHREDTSRQTAAVKDTHQ